MSELQLNSPSNVITNRVGWPVLNTIFFRCVMSKSGWTEDLPLKCGFFMEKALCAQHADFL